MGVGGLLQLYRLIHMYRELALAMKARAARSVGSSPLAGSSLSLSFHAVVRFGLIPTRRELTLFKTGGYAL